MIEIILPFPNMALSPNRKNGKSWQSTQSAKESARNAGFYAAREAIGDHKLNGDDYKLSLTYYKPSQRKYDWDNLASASKAMLDGVAQGLGIDDSQFEPVSVSRKYKKGYSATIIMIEANES